MSRPRYQQGSLKAIGKNCWMIRWREDVTNEDGSVSRVRHKETIRQKSKSQALEILSVRLSEVRQQQRQPHVTMPFEKFVRTEWKPNAALRLRKSSMRIYSFNLDNHILPAIGAVSLRDVNRSHIEAVLSKLQAKGHAVSTLRSVRATFSTVLEAAVGRRFIVDNQAHRIRIRIREADTKREPRYYQPADARQQHRANAAVWLVKGAPNLMQRLSRLPPAPNVPLLDLRKSKSLSWPHGNTTFTQQTYIRWCCIDLSNAPRLPDKRSTLGGCCSIANSFAHVAGEAYDARIQWSKSKFQP